MPLQPIQEWAARPIDMDLVLTVVYCLCSWAVANQWLLFAYGRNGNLTPIDTIGGLPVGAQGIAAK